MTTKGSIRFVVAFCVTFACAAAILNSQGAWFASTAALGAGIVAARWSEIDGALLLRDEWAWAVGAATGFAAWGAVVPGTAVLVGIGAGLLTHIERRRLTLGGSVPA